MPQFILYGTLGCHLCEMADALVDAVATAPVAKIDIADDPTLIQSYGVRIPVLCNTASGDELGWPFDADVLEQWLSQQ